MLSVGLSFALDAMFWIMNKDFRIKATRLWAPLFDAVQIPLLYNLSERDLWRLARTMVTEKFSKGHVVFHKGDPGDAFYIIQEGAFTCFDGQ